MRERRSIIGLCLCSLALTSAASREWTPSTYPNPSTDSGYQACQRPRKGFICDPDSILSRESANVVEGIIGDIRGAVDPYSKDGCNTHRTDSPGFEVTVALMDKLKVEDKSAQGAAQKFAVDLFDLWGVGDAGCQNGVLLLLSKLDRQVFIFAGKHALEAASEGKLGLVIERMKPVLRSGDYDQAVEQAVIDIGLILSGIEPPEESESSYWGLGIFLTIFTSIVGFTSWKSWRQRKDQRKVVSLLEKLKREQSTAMRTGKYPAASCPICFEDFEDTKPSAPQLPAAGNSQGNGKETQEDSSLANPLLRESEHREQSKRQNEQAKEDSGGKRRLALPCGHTFCDSCISSWLESHTTCPVCRKPMGSDDDGDAPGPSHRRPPPPSNDDECSRSRTRPMDLYQDELQFRMMGLHRMYPWYVTSSMVTHASDMAHRGQAFNFEAVHQEQMAQQVRDRHMHQGQYGSGGMSFGGGSSSGGGGVGGSW